jgi:DedD protein
VNILLKQRLIGAIVLISLAVIFIPMFFTSERDRDEQKFVSSIPPEPAYEIKSPQISVPLDLPPKSLEKVPLSEPQAQEEPQDSAGDTQEEPPQQTAIVANPPANDGQKPSVDQQNPLPVNAVQAPDSEHSGEVLESEKPKSVPETPAHIANNVTPPAKKAPAVKESSATTAENPGAVTGWIVQVGSFSQKANAEKLQDRLRKMGMACFVASAQHNGKMIYRVRVGPEIDRADAEKIQMSVKAKTKLNGLVMKYP